MIHVRTDHEELNSKRRFACGLGPGLPEGDQYYFEDEGASYRHADCPACRAALKWGDKPEIGTPFSELASQPGNTPEQRAKYENFKRIALSWGYD